MHQVLACASSFREDYGNIFDYIPITLPVILLLGSLTIRPEKELVVNKFANPTDLGTLLGVSILKEPMDL